MQKLFGFVEKWCYFRTFSNSQDAMCHGRRNRKARLDVEHNQIMFVLSANVALRYCWLLTYLLTPWCRVLLEQLTGLQLVKKFPAFHGTRRFITALTSVRHLSLSWARPIQSTCPHPTSWRSILILSTHLRLGLPSGLFPSGYCWLRLRNIKKNYGSI